jgi:hypothetical protein
MQGYPVGQPDLIGRYLDLVGVTVERRLRLGLEVAAGIWKRERRARWNFGFSRHFLESTQFGRAARSKTFAWPPSA